MQILRLFDCLTLRQLSALINFHPIPPTIFETTREFFSNFASLSRLMKVNSSLYFFSSKFVYFLRKKPIKVQVLKLSTAQVKFYYIPYVIFLTKSQFFFKVWFTLQCNEWSFFCSFSAKTLDAIDKSNTSKCKFSDLQLLELKLTKFFMSFF